VIFAEAKEEKGKERERWSYKDLRSDTMLILLNDIAICIEAWIYGNTFNGEGMLRFWGRGEEKRWMFGVYDFIIPQLMLQVGNHLHIYKKQATSLQITL